ncbi:ubiquitin carboxyl-terminal hydrolase 36 [Fopius arisanus]|uniref:Ubiquitin carboxyl-terminal hydrolase n=1 Tax=Fopius arisanus TaxID=64838 RepID=A0A9R1TPH5_9HYME|nr:PREDICTED: ubiquitin carboxyl-terminal hydrolase 36 [Fopius arisanus]
MPAVSVCDPVTSALRHSLEVQTKSSEDIAVSLASNASRILQTDIDYEETSSYDSKVLEHLKAKYIVLSLPQDHSNPGKGPQSSKKPNDVKRTGPSLPEPTTVLYQPNKITLGWKGTLPVGSGMYNVGNTCYLNSTLQALFHVPALVNWLLSDPHHTTKCEHNEGGGECLTCAMSKTLQFSHEKSGNAIKPFYIYNKLKLICRTMVPGQQEDAHEFLRYLLEGMERAYLSRHKALKLDSYSKETTPINQIFGGYIRTEVKCLQCRHVSTTFQHFQDLLVDIRKASSLDEALTSYFSREQLDNNDYKCEACKRRVPATKQFSLERPPKVLCVQLKRFSVMGGKISRHIAFKQTVDMGPYLWREPGETPRKLNYKLMSMVTHMGPSVNCGHYTAVAQVSTGQYYSFDDSCVRSINITNVLSTNAYIMIFEMEPQGNKLPSPQPKFNGLGSVRGLSNGNGVKAMSPKPSTSGIINGVNGVVKKESTPVIGPQLPHKNIQKNSFIGPQLPPKMVEKSQPRLVVHIKNGKVLSGSSLVPYDGSSDEEEAGVPGKNGIGQKGVNGGVGKVKEVKEFKDVKEVKERILTGGREKRERVEKVEKIEKVERMEKVERVEKVEKIEKVESSLNGRGSPKQNGKERNENGKDKWCPIRVNTEERVLTKAASSINGWEVTKDTPSPTSGATPNGWSVTDNKDESRKSNHTTSAPSAAAPRSFNGTNRSETVSHLLKMSHRGYGSSSVTNWNGNRSHLDREVENERREERKRHHDPDDEEMDRGRTKKLKNHREYEGRSNPGYNPFQEYQNGKTWNRGSNGPYHRRNYYNTSSHNRPRHGGNYRQQQYRYHGHNRDHWQRR